MHVRSVGQALSPPKKKYIRRPSRHIVARGQVCLVRLSPFVLLVFVVPWSGQAQIPGVPAAPSAAKPVDQDPLGRSTPRGCVVGFLKLAERGDYSRAVEYLDMPASADAAERVRQLQTVLNSGLSSEIQSLSTAPEGDLEDGLPPNRERVATIDLDNGRLDVVLRRVQKTAQPPVWLISSETLQHVPGAYAQIDVLGVARFVPGPLRETRFLSVPLYRWLVTLLGILLAIGAAWLVSRFLFPLLRLLLRRITRGQKEEPLARLLPPLRLILLAIAFRALGSISLTVLSRQFWIKLAIAMVILGITWLAIRISDTVWDLARPRLTGTSLEGRLAFLAFSRRALKFGIALVGAVALVYASGRDVTAILAGLGLGGIALALAAQKTLENVFGGVALISDQSMRVGDFCRFADKLGSVEDIGLRSTRIRTLDRTILSIPNGQLSTMTLENYTLRDKFLFNQKLGLRYETKPEQLRAVLAEIGEILRTQPHADPADARVRLVAFGDSAFTIEVFVYLFASDALHFLELQEQLLLAILDAVVANGSGLAFPSRTLYVAQDKSADAFQIEQAAARTRDRGQHILSGLAHKN